MAQRSNDPIERGLTRPTAYPEAPTSIEHIETHISHLFLTDRRAFKIKKAVELEFLDFSALERREQFCHEEVRLNSRLSPETYLGVIPVRLDHEGLPSFVGEGPIVDHAVEMRRLPQRQMLGSRLGRGRVDNADIDRIARTLATFHAGAERGPEIDRRGEPARILRNALDNLDALDDMRPIGVSAAQLKFLRARTEAFGREHDDLLRARVENGRIVDGHGDLHADNICFAPSGLVIYDCIEFSPDFRCLDVACDLAFLAMDLDARGFRGFSRYLVRKYQEYSGDSRVDEVLGFYKGYRALVRAKVAAIRSRQDEDPAHQREACRYVHLACAYFLPPFIALTCGLPGSGKSTGARGMARPFEAAVLRSDRVRKDLVGRRSEESASDGFREGAYHATVSDETYERLETLTRQHTAATIPRPVILDATFHRRARREPFRRLAAELGLPFVTMEFVCDRESTRARLDRRAAAGDDISDADYSIYTQLEPDYEPPDELDGNVGRVTGDFTEEAAASEFIDRLIATHPDATAGI